MGYEIIHLNRGLEAKVSPADYAMVREYSWTYHKDSRSSEERGYAVHHFREGRKKKKIYMHRLIVSPPQGLVVDHVNGLGLDNRRENLRIATYTQNNMNRASSSQVGFKGVVKVNRRYRSYIRVSGKAIHLGYFDSAEEAAVAYDEAAIGYYGPYAWLNMPRDAYPQLLDVFAMAKASIVDADVPF